MKTGHVVAGIGVLAVGAGAFWYFTRQGKAGSYYPGAQGYPQNMPGGQAQNVGNVLSPGTDATAQKIVAAGAAAGSLLPAIGKLWESFGGSDSDNSDAPATEVIHDDWLSANTFGDSATVDPYFYT
jgi:hypothetical protein